MAFIGVLMRPTFGRRHASFIRLLKIRCFHEGDRELFAGFIGEMNREIAQLTGIKDFGG